MLNTIFVRVIWVGLLLALPNASQAAFRVGGAQVRLVDDKPCFALADQEQANEAPIEVRSLILYDKRSRPPKKIWSLRSSVNPPLQLNPDQCLVYGLVPEGMIESGKAIPLEPGVIYSVYVSVRPKNPRSPTQGYTRSFCLKGDSDKQMEIKEIRWDNTNKRWRYDVCEETPAALSDGVQLNMHQSAQ